MTSSEESMNYSSIEAMLKRKTQLENAVVLAKCLWYDAMHEQNEGFAKEMEQQVCTFENEIHTITLYEEAYHTLFD